MDEKIKLKPCPFCGGKAEIQKFIYDRYTEYAVRCGNLLVCGVIARTIVFDNEKAAVRVWNTRRRKQ